MKWNISYTVKFQSSIFQYCLQFASHALLGYNGSKKEIQNNSKYSTIMAVFYEQKQSEHLGTFFLKKKNSGEFLNVLGFYSQTHFRAFCVSCFSSLKKAILNWCRTNSNWEHRQGS